MGDGTFAPDAPVTYEQALKMVVCTLGLCSVCRKLGEWPEGFIKQANTLDLTKKVNSTGYSEGATRGMIAGYFTTHLKYLYTKTTVTTGLQQRNSYARTT